MNYAGPVGAAAVVRGARRGKLFPVLLVVVAMSACSDHPNRTRVAPGPYRFLPVGQTQAPFYLINYDKDGRCESPLTLERVVSDAASNDYSDIILISHGWNNDWPAATDLYNDFLGNYEQLRARHAAEVARPYKPLFIGVIWPSTLLVSASEEGPVFEAAQPGSLPSGDDFEQSAARRQARDLADQLAGDDPVASAKLQERILQYTAKGAAFTPADSDGLATLLAPLVGQEDGPSRATDAADALKSAALVAAANAGTVPVTPPAHHSKNPNTPVSNHPASGPAPTSGPESGPAGNAAGSQPAGAPAAPEVAPAQEALSLPDPRWIVRVASVYLMKDRAGVVGDVGVSVMLQQLVNGTNARVHLVGHSFGAKVVLAALCAAPDLQRKVDSVLLLEPAISCYSLAARVPHSNQAGKYRPALDRSEKPIFSTFSDQDVPLLDIYQYFVRRPKDTRETARAEAAAAAPDAPPRADDFAALGGFGPQPLPAAEMAGGEVIWTFLRPEGQRYDLPGGARIVGLRNKGNQIPCHGCVSNEFTWWALWQQVSN